MSKLENQTAESSYIKILKTTEIIEPPSIGFAVPSQYKTSFEYYITGTGVKINFEHIDGKLNIFIDSLSRLIEEKEESIHMIRTEDEWTRIMHPDTTTSFDYKLLNQYEALVASSSKSVFPPEEHNKRKRMAEIEEESINQLSFAFKELELIQQVKESDFYCRRHWEGAKQHYFLEKSQDIGRIRRDIWRVSNSLNDIYRDIRQMPP